MQRYGQKTSKIPLKWVFSPICDVPRFLIKNQALSLLYPYGALTSCKKLKKIDKKLFQASLKTNRPAERQIDRQMWLLWTSLGKSRDQNNQVHKPGHT